MKMYSKIKQLADNAIALQNKDQMDAVLREISALCDADAPFKPLWPTIPEAILGKYHAAIEDVIDVNPSKKGGAK
jgi:hypothetical protein